MGLLEQNYRALVERESLSHWLPYVAFEDGLYLLDDGGYGFMFDCQPLPVAGTETARLLEDLYTIPQLPPNTFINLFLFASPRIGPHLRYWAQGKHGKIYEQLAWHRAKLYAQGAKAPLFDDIGFSVRDFRLVISFRLPGIPKQDWKTWVWPKLARFTTVQKEEVIRIREACRGALSIAQMAPLDMDPAHFIPFMQSILNPSHRLDDEPVYDQGMPVRDQMIFSNTRIERGKPGCLTVDKRTLKALTIKQYPGSIHLGEMNDLVGDLMQRSKQIPTPFVYSFTVQTLDQELSRNDLHTKAAMATYQSFGPMANFLPKLTLKKNNYDIATSAIERDGKHLVKVSMALFMFSRDSDEAEKAARMATGLLKLKGFTTQEEDAILFPIFLGFLPLGMTLVRDKFLQRSKLVLSHNAAHLSPVQADWKGTGPDKKDNAPPLIYLSRRGQPMFVDLFASATNYNATVLATSGSGKSFWSNDMIQNYLGLGGRVWTIDIGRSYEKLAGHLNGEFIRFSEEQAINLNPFTNAAKDPKTGGIVGDEMELLVSLCSSMAFFSRPPNDIERGYVESAINKAWRAEGNDATITTVARMLEEGFDDRRAQDIAQMLYPYTKEGRYRSYFEGPANLDFNANFVVLELEELQSKPSLLSVVLANLMSRIGQAMYLGDRGQKKICLMDEAHTLLGGGVSGDFIVQGYRRFRKYGGSAVIISQSLNDLYRSEAGRVAFENSEHMFLLRQKVESLELLRDSKRLMLADWYFELLKTVHKDGQNRYSEVFIYNSSGCGIARLVVDPAAYFLFTTQPQEVAFIDDCVKRGMSLHQAIDEAIVHFLGSKRVAIDADDILSVAQPIGIHESTSGLVGHA